MTHATDLGSIKINPAFNLKLPQTPPRVAFWGHEKVSAMVEVAVITVHCPDHITSVIMQYLALNEPPADNAIRLLSAWLDEQGIAL